MADTTLAALGSSVIVGPKNDEEIIPAEGNGSAIPGDLVSIATASGQVVGADIGASELFVGILMEHPVLGTDTAITAALPCSIVRPISGHRYRIRCLDLGADTELGSPLDISATAGKADAAADGNNAMCNVSLPNTDNDTIVEVWWN